MRLGGMVEKGSLKRDADGVTIRFIVSDGKATRPVVYRGITPDLFREGSGVVAEGRLDPDGLFVADNILAKHDERYMPPQMATRLPSTAPNARDDRRGRPRRVVAGGRAGRAAARRWPSGWAARQGRRNRRDPRGRGRAGRC